jgi:transcriptional regulator with GAF, ATPase, and Fis domain
VKLLRVLQEKELERVGGNTPIKADVRVIAATNRDLSKARREGAFRDDLFYRLNVFPIHLPPLRERGGDIPLLVNFLMQRAAMRVGRRFEGVSRETMDRLTRYAWPGNIRELENVIERAAILSAGPLLEVGPELLPSVTPATPAALATSLEHVERAHIIDVLEKASWVIEGDRGAAKALDMHPNTLRSRLKKLGIARPGHEIS